MRWNRIGYDRVVLVFFLSWDLGGNWLDIHYMVADRSNLYEIMWGGNKFRVLVMIHVAELASIANEWLERVVNGMEWNEESTTYIATINLIQCWLCQLGRILVFFQAGNCQRGRMLAFSQLRIINPTYLHSEGYYKGSSCFS